MKSFKHQTLLPLIHEGSRWPWLSAKCCGTRVNHCGPVVEMNPPSKYGNSPVTHTQERSCKCGKTILVVEGTRQDFNIVGCFALPAESQQTEPSSEAGEEEDEEDNSCPDCQGTGIGYPPPDAKCWHCKGRGTKAKPTEESQ